MDRCLSRVLFYLDVAFETANEWIFWEVSNDNFVRTGEIEMYCHFVYTQEVGFPLDFTF